MKGLWVDALLWVLASPILLLRALWRAFQHGKFLELAAASQIPCACGQAISLLGLWRCACGFTYQGHLLRICPVCATLPRVVRCYACGVTTKLPEPRWQPS